MIVVRLSGGLGNQLFQYALARSLMSKGQNVRLDGSFLAADQGSQTKRNCLVQKFNIEVGFINFYQKVFFKVLGLINIIVPKKRKIIIYDNNFVFDSDVLKLNGNKYLLGNWLSPRYFEDIRTVLLKEISLVSELSSEANFFLSKILSSNSVSIHVRHGDYVKYSNKFKLLDLDYYTSAIEYIRSKINNPTFFIFTDDIDYVRNKLGFSGDNFIYVSGNGIPDYEDLVLMSKCSHNIIANSSFSFWAGWLNQNRDKVVIAPKILRSDFKDTSDFIPDYLEWIRL